MRIHKGDSMTEETPNTSSQTKLRSRLNGAKVLSPLWAALLRKPGLAGDAQALNAAIGEIAGLHRTVTEQVQSVLCPDDQHPAARATLAAPLAEMVAKAWQTQGSELNPAGLAQVFVSTVQMTDPRPDTVFDNQLPRYIEQSLFESRALAATIPLFQRVHAMPAAKLFVGDQDFSQSMEHFRAELQDRAQQLVQSMCSDDVSDSDRQIAYKSVFKTLAIVGTQALETEFLQMGRSFKSMDADERKAYLEKLPNHPNGVLFDRVFTHMDQDAIPALYPGVERPDMQPTGAERRPN